ALVGQLDHSDGVAVSRSHGAVRGAIVTIEDVERRVVAGYGRSKAAVEVGLSVVAADDYRDPGPPEPQVRQPPPGPRGRRVQGELGNTLPVAQPEAPPNNRVTRHPPVIRPAKNRGPRTAARRLRKASGRALAPGRPRHGPRKPGPFRSPRAAG